MMENQVVLEAVEKVRQGLKTEGGDIDLINYKDDIIYVKLKGSCDGCPMAGLTVKNWVEKTLFESIPSLKEVKVM
ncbi:MAG: NifU family protein [Nitrospirae bacterium]|nr:NifU family protein [Nitrospirota bacterium]MBF0540051.1 NifU family protein [Nitrospirota bacterium]